MLLKDVLVGGNGNGVVFSIDGVDVDMFCAVRVKENVSVSVSVLYFSVALMVYVPGEYFCLLRGIRMSLVSRVVNVSLLFSVCIGVPVESVMSYVSVPMPVFVPLSAVRCSKMRLLFCVSVVVVGARVSDMLVCVFGVEKKT